MKTIVAFHQLLLFADSDQLLHRQSCSRWRNSRHVLHSISGDNNTHQLSYRLQDLIINIIICIFNNRLTWDCQLCGVFMKILKITVLKSIEIRIMVRLSRFSSWVTIYCSSLFMFFSSFSSEQHLFNVGTCQPSCASSVLLHRSCRWALIFLHRKWIFTSIYHKWSIKGNINCERIELSLIGRSLVTLCLHIFKTASTF